ncbi:unnamed protein product, partial [Rotaria sordida]
LLITFVICQTVSLYDRNDDNDNTYESYNQFKSLTPQQLADLDEFLSRKLGDESSSLSSGEVLYRNTRRPHQHLIVKRDALWTTTEVLECIRRLKYSKNVSKLDLVTEMLNCYRRLKHSARTNNINQNITQISTPIVNPMEEISRENNIISPPPPYTEEDSTNFDHSSPSYVLSIKLHESS